jgi:hypothetical protein
MAGLQTILNAAETIEFNRRKVVGIQTSRNEISFRNETVTKNPWKLTVQFPAYLPYATNRDLIESLDTLDRISSQTVSFSGNSGLSWICAYQGTMSQAQLDTLTVKTFSGNQLVLENIPALDNNFPSDRIVFKAGDFIQISGFPYPFTIVNNVQRGSGSDITLTTHRPNFISGSVVGHNIFAGNAVSFKVFCPNMPTYTIIPGRYIVFNDAFQLFEDVGAA